ncbi:hypothetical protein [Amphritea sp. HPY]|uniref:hypothetical protein n=1 Tax=Amphritea sp. HPY TaxID=3421652 RepID=UPI003D7D2F06
MNTEALFIALLIIAVCALFLLFGYLTVLAGYAFYGWKTGIGIGEATREIRAGW